jgi:hypothetical protein
MTSLVVGCRNEHGVDEDRTYCIDIGNNSLSNIMKGSKISYDSSTLKIGHCQIQIANHWVFGGSWCAEEFLTSDKQILKLLKYLKKTGNWSIEEAEESFELLWRKL